MYLFTNDHVNLCGVYELPDKYIVPTLGVTLDQLAEFKTKFQKDNKYAFYNNWIYIINFSEHNKYSSAMPVIKSFIKDFNSIPDDVYNHFFNDLSLTYISPIENYNNVMVIDKVMVKKGRPYPRDEARLLNEAIDLDAVAEALS